jgi:adenylylsulfate kinase
LDGRVFWITGLSGAGKSTVAGHLVRRFRDHAVPAILLDGDRLRAAIAPKAGHGESDRRALAFAYARLCGELAGQGFVVVCATVSMFQVVRDWSRASVRGYREIYLRVPLSEIRARDPKGLYRAGAADVVGVDVPAEEPANPDMTIENYGACGPEAACDRIWTDLVEPDRPFAKMISKTQ